MRKDKMKTLLATLAALALWAGTRAQAVQVQVRPPQECAGCTAEPDPLLAQALADILVSQCPGCIVTEAGYCSPWTPRKNSEEAVVSFRVLLPDGSCQRGCKEVGRWTNKKGRLAYAGLLMPAIPAVCKD